MEVIDKLFESNFFPLIAGIVGFITGIAGRYWITIIIDQKRSKKLAQRLHCLLIGEIHDHLTSLSRTIDIDLPIWLLRGEKKYLDSTVINHAFLSTANFDMFFDKLFDSAFLIKIAEYYNKVKALNDSAINIPDVGVKDHNLCVLYFYQDCYVVLLRAIDLFDLMIKKIKISESDRDILTPRIKDYYSQKETYLYRAELIKYRYKDLLLWNSDLNDGNAENIPTLFSKNTHWLSYLEASQEIIENNKKSGFLNLEAESDFTLNL